MNPPRGNMKTGLLIWFFGFFLTSGSAFSAELPGTIYFEDGTTQHFQELTAISAFLNASTSTSQQDGLTVEYKNTIRVIPYSKLNSIEVLKYKVEKTKRLNKEYLKEPRLKITTTTGIILEMDFIAAHSVYAILHDDLTDEVISQEIAFAKDEKLNIRRIEFHVDGGER
jgi:hypothetical protein